MQNVSVVSEHVNLLDSSDRSDVELLESGLELLVVGLGGSDGLLDHLTTGSSLSSCESREKVEGEEMGGRGG